MGNVIPLPPNGLIKQTMDRWRTALPLHHHLIVQTVANYVEIKRGRRDREFLFEVERHTVQHLTTLYDMVATPDERKKMRKYFREIMSRYRRFAELHGPLRTRLREHKMFVICGLDPPDLDERRKGKRDDAA
jgi:hypothetical protein